MTSGIDISEHNGIIDLSKIKASGYDYAILRTGYGDTTAGRKDKMFENYYSQAETCGMSKGAYHYLYSVSTDTVAGEAANCLNILKGKHFDYPIYADFEDPTQANLTPETMVDIVYEFCLAIENAGYFVGWYTYLYLYNKMATASNFGKLGRFCFWLAQYAPSASMSVNMWQYTSDGEVPGSSPRTDLNICYFDYPSAIKEKGLNGYGNGQKPESSLPFDPVQTSCKYGVGTPVCTGRIWSSSTDTGDGYTGDWQYNITRVVPGALHPYLIGNGIGWTDDASIDADPHTPGMSSKHDVWIVDPGDTLSKIAVYFNCSLAALIQYNDIANPNIIYPGQKIYKPK